MSDESLFQPSKYEQMVGERRDRIRLRKPRKLNPTVGWITPTFFVAMAIAINLAVGRVAYVLISDFYGWPIMSLGRFVLVVLAITFFVRFRFERN